MLKDEVLKLLKSEDDYLSGQRISTLLGVSRTAVWKSIALLKAEGYAVSAVSNRGYRLLPKEDILNRRELEEGLLEKGLNIKVVYEERTGSTNLLAKENAGSYVKEDVLFVAGEQSAGRGRRGRTWFSPGGEGIWMSLLLHPQMESHKAGMLTLLAALAAAKSLEDLGFVPGIKWPNDIVLGKKKVCGILTEMSADMDGIHYVICGIGMNVSTRHFPEDLAELATSLYTESGRLYSRKEIIADLLLHFYRLYPLLLQEGSLSSLQKDYEGYLLGKGERIQVHGAKGTYAAMQGGINDRGELLVYDEEGKEHALLSGEVSIRGLYSYT